MRPWLPLLLLLGCSTPDPEPEPPTGPPPGEPLGLQLPRHSITADELGVLVNLDDPVSAAIADAYMAARSIPAAHRIELSLGTGPNLGRDAFQLVYDELDAAFGDEIQALVLTSVTPQTVDCMAVSAAFALGFHERWCQPGPPCNPTAPADSYDSDGSTPFTDHGVRPTMVLAAETLPEAQALIDRGVASDSTFPRGRGFAIRTSDEARSSRFASFAEAEDTWADRLDFTYIDSSDGTADALANEDDLLFYWTGLVEVPDLDTLGWRPGAVADHLTSFGGQIPTSSQMSAIEWLRSGATASYGTPIEPCNYPAKFPDPTVFLPHYVGGDTVVEAYWKSVWTPGEGNFLGEPLARPFGGAATELTDGGWAITTAALEPGVAYVVQRGETDDGPWADVADIEPMEQIDITTVLVPDPVQAWYRLVEE